MLPQQYCLRWKYHHSNLQTMFSQLLDRGCFCDVTLACEGQLIRAHRVVLCACSSYFDTVLTNYSNERDPIIIMKDVTFADVKCLIEFMYKGEINVEHAHLASLLKTADDLKIKGLAEVTWRENEEDAPPMPTPTAEYYSPRHAAKAYYGNDTTHRRTPSPPVAAEELTLRVNNARTRTRSPTPQPLPLKVQTRMPTLTPIPHNVVENCMPMHVSPNVEHYMGVKRKRGRPPLDDTYDVFNLRQQYVNLEQQAYLEATRQYAEEQQKQLQLHHQQQQQQQQRKQEQQQRQELRERPATPTNKTAAAAAAYQEHVQQQQMKQRLLQQQREHAEAAAAAASAAVEVEMTEAPAEPEWISSNLEVNVTEVNQDKAQTNGESANEKERERQASLNKPAEEAGEQARKPSVDESATLPIAIPKQEQDNDSAETTENRATSPAEQKIEVSDEKGDGHNVPKPVEELETLEQQQQPGSGKSNSPTPTPSTSPTAMKIAPPLPPPPPPATALPSNTTTQSALPAHVSHYNKYAPEGYLVNEHGILMAPDFVHAPTVAIPSGSQANGSGSSAVDHHGDYGDIKMEDFDAADLRLTSEEITQWQDVIKMDDYLAKGRRPQFWEEPFTRRVLDAIKNKHLEMKKAARILGVSYGTLYGRYREVYGCLKHPYSGTSLRPNQLSLPPRLEYPFRAAGPTNLPAQLEIGKIRPKDLSELWARPQI